MTDVIERLRDLHKQATTERSHFYVAKTCEIAIDHIQQLRLHSHMKDASIELMAAENAKMAIEIECLTRQVASLIAVVNTDSGLG